MLTFFVFFVDVFLDEVVFFGFIADLVTFVSLVISFEDVLIDFSFSAFNIFSASSFETSLTFDLACFFISLIIFSS